MLGDELEAGELDHAVGDAEPLAAAGLVAERSGRVSATVRIVPHDDLLVASDRDGPDTGAEHVPGVQGPSATLAHLTVRRPVQRALDLGTGNGIQSLLLARHAERVVATDVNERALAYAAFNAALNSVRNVELRAGSFFEPVQGERFGLAVSNPPYVVSPDTALLFRDGGLPRDGVSELVVRGMPAVLEEGGFATVMASWASGADPAERPRRWLDGAPCDAWLLHTSVDDPLTTATEWNRELVADPPAYEEAVERWLAYYRAEGIERLAYGLVVLRRRDAPRHWRASVELPGSPRRAAGPHLERLFAARDALEGLDDVTLRARRVRLVREARLRQTLAPGAGGWEQRSAELGLDDGLPFAGDLDATSWPLALALDGSLTVGDAVDATGLGEAGLALVRRLVELGLAELAP